MTTMSILRNLETCSHTSCQNDFDDSYEYDSLDELALSKLFEDAKDFNLDELPDSPNRIRLKSGGFLIISD